MQTLLIRPTPLLSGYITQFWLWEQATPLAIPDILPGTGVEILLNFGAPLAVASPEPAWLKPGDGLVVCPRKSIFRLKATGATKLLSVRFRSAGFFRLFGLPLTAISDQIVEASHIIPREVLQQMSEPTSDIEAISLLEAWLMQQVKPQGTGASELEWAIDKIYYQNGHDVLADIKRNLNVSERTFQRKFKAYTGVDAKYFARTSRFQSTLRALLSGRSCHYTDAALAHGYYDQPHFIKEFKLFTGQTPKYFLTEENFSLNHYNNEIYGQ